MTDILRQHSMAKALKQKLQESLSKIQDFTTNPKRIKRVNDAIQSVIIPEKDYQNVEDFILLLLSEQPEILDCYPQNENLRKLFVDCGKRGKTRDELSYKSSSRKNR